MINREELYEKYKHLFVDKWCGFEVPDTWMWIIEEYLKKTQWDVDKNGLQLVILQIKEKFGGLRIYTQVMIDDVHYLDEANQAYCKALADHTCAKCGIMHKDTKATSGWITYLCPTCMEEHSNGSN